MAFNFTLGHKLLRQKLGQNRAHSKDVLCGMLHDSASETMITIMHRKVLFIEEKSIPKLYPQAVEIIYPTFTISS